MQTSQMFRPEPHHPAGRAAPGAEPDSPGMWLPMYLMCISCSPTSVGAYLTVTVPSLLSTISGVAVFPEGMWTSPVGAQGDRAMSPRGLPPETLSAKAQVAFRSKNTHCCRKHRRSTAGKQSHVWPLFCSLFLPQNTAGNSSKEFSTLIWTSEKLKLD